MRVASVLIAVGLLGAALPAASAASAGDVYVADDNSALTGAIWKVGPGGGAPTLLNSGLPFDEPSGFTFDHTGDLLVADDVGAIIRVDLPSGARTIFAQGPPLSSPERIAVAPDGAVYVTDLGTTDAVYRIDPVTRAITPVAVEPTILSPRGIAITRDGFAFVGTFDFDGYYRVNLSTGATEKIIPPGVDSVSEVTLSPDERTLYFADRSLPNPSVGLVNLVTGQASPVSTGFTPSGIALRRDRGLLVTETNNDQVRLVSPSGALSTFSAGGYGFPVDVLVEPALCRGQFPTVAGTDAAEVLRGSPSRDVIRGEGGRDRILGLGGKDVLCGGKGKDVIKGGNGKDVLAGEAGNDRLVGGKGRDRCNGGKGTDRRAAGCEKVSKVP